MGVGDPWLLQTLGAALQALHYGRSSSQVSSWGQKSTMSPWATAPPRLTQKQGPCHAWQPAPICDADSGGTQGQASTRAPCQPMEPLFTIHALLCPSLPGNESYSLTEAVTLPLTYFQNQRTPTSDTRKVVYIITAPIYM